MIFTTSFPTITGAKWNRWDIVQAYYHYCNRYHSGARSEEYAKLCHIGTYYSPNNTEQLYLTENAARIYANLVIENQADAYADHDLDIELLKKWDELELWDIYEDYQEYLQLTTF